MQLPGAAVSADESWDDVEIAEQQPVLVLVLGEAEQFLLESYMSKGFFYTPPSQFVATVALSE